MGMFVNGTRRAVGYFRRYGLRCTIKRLGTAVSRIRSAGTLIVYSCDLPIEQYHLSVDFSVEWHRSILSATKDIAVIKSLWVESIVEQSVKERFDSGAMLWLAKKENALIAYGWTIEGRTVRAHYLPLQASDAHLFDFYVLPEYRGRGVNVGFVHTILTRLGAGEVRRAWIECAAWNDAQIKSLAKTPFKRHGAVKLYGFGRYSVSLWNIGLT